VQIVLPFRKNALIPFVWSVGVSHDCSGVESMEVWVSSPNLPMYVLILLGVFVSVS